MILELQSDDSLTLLEAPHLPEGNLKGKEKVYFTTDSKTFSLRKVSTSNSLLLLDEHDAYLFQEYWELSESLGQVNELQGLLEAVPFKGLQEEKRAMENYGKDYSDEILKLRWESLQDLPVSDHELTLELEKRHAFLYNGSYRIMDSEYLNQILLLIKLSVIEYSLDWDSLSWNSLKILSIEHDIPEEVLSHTLKCVSKEYYEENGDVLYKVSEEEWARIIAENGFIHKSWSGSQKEVFLKKWKDLVPESFNVDLEWLKGMTYIKEDKIYYFPKSALEIDPKQRFSQLFLAKKKWSREELIPFIADLTPGNQKGLDTLLVKWTRKIKDGKAYYYVSR